ncbi:MAG: thioredoxin family protein, partial [Dehalococcoidia bacterium]
MKIEHFTQRPLAILVPGRDDGRFCAAVRQVLEELRGLSPKIGLRIHELGESRDAARRYRVDHAPASVFRGQLNRPLLFYGFFSGVLFPAIVEIIGAVSQGTLKMEARLKRRLQRIRDDVSVRLFVSPASEHSVNMMLSLYRFSLENPRIKATVIEAEEFPNLVQARQIAEVPFTIIGDRISFAGAVEEEQFLDQIIRVVEGRALTAGAGLLGSGSRLKTPLSGSREPGPTRSGLYIPGR